MFSEYLHQETESRNALNAWPTFTTKIYLVKYILIYMSWILCLKLNSKSFLLQENVEILSSMFAVNAVRQKSRYFYMTIFYVDKGRGINYFSCTKSVCCIAGLILLVCVFLSSEKVYYAPCPTDFNFWNLPPSQSRRRTIAYMIAKIRF